MGRTQIINVSGRGEALLKLLKTKGRIDNYRYIGNTRFEFEFHGETVISLDDYLAVAPGYLRDSKSDIEYLKREFRDNILLPIINSLRGGEVKEFSSTRIVLRDTSRERRICFRVTEEEYEKLKQKAAEKGVTVSELIRSAVTKEI